MYTKLRYTLKQKPYQLVIQGFYSKLPVYQILFVYSKNRMIGKNNSQQT